MRYVDMRKRVHVGYIGEGPNCVHHAKFNSAIWPHFNPLQRNPRQTHNHTHTHTLIQLLRHLTHPATSTTPLHSPHPPRHNLPPLHHPQDLPLLPPHPPRRRTHPRVRREDYVG